MTHRMVMTYSSWIWEDEEEFPIEDNGYYEPSWGEWSSFKDDDTPWDDAEMLDRRNASMIDVEPDEWDLDDDITLAQKAADLIENEGCAFERDQWFSSEADCVDYRTGKYRSYSLHFVEEDWTPEEIDSVHEELNFREATVKARWNQRYFDSVKAIV